MSPITGLSESRRLPRLGKIRLGVKATAQSGKEYPKAVDYFVCPPEVQAIYGEKPKSIDIIFPLEMEPDQWQWYKAYSLTRGLICKGDGKTATALIDTETGKFASKISTQTALCEVVCDCDKCPLYEKKQCHRVMNLQVILPKVKALGIYQIDTGSVNSILNVQSTLDLVKNIVGRFSMIPMKLVLGPQEAQVEGKKKTIHVLQLVIEKSLDELVELPNLPRSRVLLPTSDAEAPDDLYPPDFVASDPEERPAQLSERPAPRQPRRRSVPLLPPPTEPQGQAAAEEADPEDERIQPEEKAPPVEAKSAFVPKLRNEGFGSVTDKQRMELNPQLKADPEPARKLSLIHI